MSFSEKCITWSLENAYWYVNINIEPADLQIAERNLLYECLKIKPASYDISESNHSTKSITFFLIIYHFSLM